MKMKNKSEKMGNSESFLAQEPYYYAYLAVTAPGGVELDKDTVLLRSDDRVEVLGSKLNDLTIGCEKTKGKDENMVNKPVLRSRTRRRLL